MCRLHSHSRTVTRITYLSLQYLNNWYTNLLVFNYNLTLLLLEVLAITAAYSAIRLRDRLNIIVYSGLLIDVIVALFVVERFLRISNLMADASTNCLRSIQRSLTTRLKNKQKLREIRMRMWNIPVHHALFISVLSEVILSNLITLLLNFEVPV